MSDPGYATAAAPRSVALIVLNYERRDLLLECLAEAATSTHEPLELVVVDNGSRDGSADAAAEAAPHAHVLRSDHNRGVAGGRNFGARFALEQLDVAYLLFIDNDTFVEPGSVTAMVDQALASDAGMVAPKAFRKRGDTHLLSAGGLRFNPYSGSLVDIAADEFDTGQYDEPRVIQAVPGFAFLVRRDVFDVVDGFDEQFNPYGWEDADFSLRAGRAGVRIVYAPDAVVYHRGGRAGRGAVEHYEHHKARSMLYFVRRHTNRFQWCCFLALLPFRAAARVLKELRAGRSDLVRAWLRGTRSGSRRSENER